MSGFNANLPDQIPFSPFLNNFESRCDLANELIVDGLSRPRIATLLRRWALSFEDVRRLVIYHTGNRYSIAILAVEPTVSRIRELNGELIELLSDDLFPPSKVPVTYVVGRELADAPMFRRLGAITVIDKDQLQIRCAA
jgi:hypothetical protein